MTFRPKALLAAIFVLTFLAGQVAAQRAEKVRWQFSAEGAISYPKASIPHEVFRILEQDDGVRAALEAQNGPNKETPHTWFQASSIHLKDSNEDDFVVQGTGPILGANVTTFWVFRMTGDKATLLLKVIAHDLLVKSTRRNGYLAIDAVSATASTVTTTSFEIKGNSYAKYHERTEQIQ